jgi:hypothetical protein
MNFAFTICSNNYLAQAAVLGNSLKRNAPEFRFIIFLVDSRDARVDYGRIAAEVITIEEIEPDFQRLLHQFNIIELNTCIKPRAIEYLFSLRHAQKVIYLDPDIKTYDSLKSLSELLELHSIILTPHILSPIPHDNKTPAENLFLNYGLYNLGFIALNKSSECLRFITWWKDWTYTLGYDRVADGLFVDQLPINFVPIFFQGVLILTNPGYNMGPWNLHERFLSSSDDHLTVNNKDPLVFYHFSSFRMGSNELPIWRYNRFIMTERKDLHRLYQSYEQELKESGLEFYSGFPWAFTAMQKENNSELTITNSRQSFLSKVISLVFDLVPISYTNKLQDLLAQRGKS